MRGLKYLRKLVIGSVFGLLVAGGAAVTASAQNVSEEYREWQQAQARAQREYRDYLRSRDRSDYRQWQDAQRRAQEEYREYQMAANRTGYYNNPYSNGYYNNGYNNRYYSNNRYGNVGRYRIYTNGSYYSTDSRGVELLRQAVRNGYAQGYRQGQQERRYGNGYDYYGNSMYRSGTYGYQSYVDRNQYQYYFQQGFQKGYEDGYYSRTRYGYQSGNGLNILGNVLNTILNIAQD